LLFALCSLLYATLDTRPSKTQGTCHPDLFLRQCVSVFISGLGIEGEQPNSRRLKPVLRTGDTVNAFLHLEPV
jgi:hypothetical protein